MRFTECNGRWGGTSIPMCLVDRLTEGPRPPYRAQDVMLESLRGATLTDVTARLDGHLYDPATGAGRFVLYNPGPLSEIGKIDVIAICDTQDAAEEAMEVDLPALL